MKQKILFLHGFFASGHCVPALALKDYFLEKADVLTPDLPLHPLEALAFIQHICDKEHPNLLIANSNGSFLGQIIASKNHLPALLGNPHLEMTRFLSDRMGVHQYKTPRTNGHQELIIDQPLIDEFAEVQEHQWDYAGSADPELIWGLFGENDTLAHYEPLFLKYYKHAFHFPGDHTPTADEVIRYYAPLAEQLYEKSMGEGI